MSHWTTLMQAAEPAAMQFGWVSLVPPFVAIALALILRQVIPALIAGIWIGAWATHGWSLLGAWQGLIDIPAVYAREALADADHAAIILFSLLIGGLVGIVSRNGGMAGIVARIAGFARDARRASLATAAMGLAIFFDDYANSLVVGNTMRPITDRFGVSRAKLAYIVDSTAAPVSAIAFITTWIGYEVGLIGDALANLGITDTSGYAVFLDAVGYSFYPLLAIAMVFLITGSGRDFGPMLGASGRVQRSVAQKSLEAEVEADPERPARARNAIVPILVMVIIVIGGLLSTGAGEGKSLREVVSDADPYLSLLWGSFAGVVVAIAITLAQRIANLEQCVEAGLAGMRSMFLAIVILVLAWALASITEVMGSADYLVSLLNEGLPVFVLPTLVFVVAAVTAFATGTSWGTMAILLPLVVPIAFGLTGGDVGSPVFLAAVASVLSGAVWGDHCSPISDTTILSSMACGCDHIEHVRTQLPYAMVVGVVAILAGVLPASFGVPWWVGLAMGILALAGVVFTIGKPTRVNQEEAPLGDRQAAG